MCVSCNYIVALRYKKCSINMTTTKILTKFYVDTLGTSENMNQNAIAKNHWNTNLQFFPLNINLMNL